MAAIDIFQISGDFTYVDNLTLDESVQVTKAPLNIISAKKLKKKNKTAIGMKYKTYRLFIVKF